MEERVHPIPFRTRKLSSPSPMILHNVMWESRPLSTIAPKPLAATSARGFVFCICCGRMPHPPLPAFHSACPCAPSHFSPLSILPFIHPSFTPSFFLVTFWFLISSDFFSSSHEVFAEPVSRVYPNPSFTPSMRQRRDFDAHVLEYAALKIPALPFQDKKCAVCKFAQHQHIASASAPASLRKATPRPSPDHVWQKARC